MQSISIHGGWKQPVSQDNDTSRSYSLSPLVTGRSPAVTDRETLPTSETRGDLGQYFVRLNPNFLERITVLEMPEAGGELVCIHGDFRPPAAVANMSAQYLVLVCASSS